MAGIGLGRPLEQLGARTASPRCIMRRPSSFTPPDERAELRHAARQLIGLAGAAGGARGLEAESSRRTVALSGPGCRP